MNPMPYPTRLEQAAAMDVSAQKEQKRGNLVFAKELADCAHQIRMEETHGTEDNLTRCANLFCRCHDNRRRDPLAKYQGEQ